MVKSATTTTTTCLKYSLRKSSNDATGSGSNITQERTILSKIAVDMPLISLPSSSSSLPSSEFLTTMLNDDMLQNILSYVGSHQYYYVARVNRMFHKAYVALFPWKTTLLLASSIELLNIWWDEINIQPHGGACKQYSRNKLWNATIRCGKISVVKHFLEVLLLTPHAQAMDRSLYEKTGCSSYRDIFFSYLICGLDYKAAKHGHLELLQWACHENMGVNKDDFRVCHFSLLNGHMDVFHWAVHNGFHWNNDECDDIVLMAVINGSLEPLQWIHEKTDCDLSMTDGNHRDNLLCYTAAKYGHVEVLKWLRSIGCLWNEYCIYVACYNGHLDAVRYMAENGCSLGDKACRFAVLNGSLTILQFLRSCHCEWDEFVPAYAACFGHVHLIEWAMKNGCTLSASTCFYAATKGEWETLKWLRANGCPWDERTTSYAESEEIYEWAVANGCPVEVGNPRHEPYFCPVLDLDLGTMDPTMR